MPLPVAVGAFFARPLVKWVGGGLVVALLIWFAVGKWNDFKDDLREEGRVEGFAEAETHYLKRIEENNAHNRRTEELLAGSLATFATAFENLSTQRVAAETRIERTIERQIASKPEIYKNEACTIPADVIEGRNQIRAMGPSPTQVQKETE